MKIKPLLNRDLSWLSFNARVLQEANDKNVPLLERVKFLGIFSNNLDEFFRVRVASLKRIMDFKRLSKTLNSEDAKSILYKVKKIVLEQQIEFNRIYNNDIVPELANNEIYIIDGTKVNEVDLDELETYFESEINPRLFPILLSGKEGFPHLADGQIYLAVLVKKRVKSYYYLVNIPVGALSRFYVMANNTNKIILIEDIIRLFIGKALANITYEYIEAWTVKITRDAELDMDESTENLHEKISSSVKQRTKGVVTRFLYDEQINPEILAYFISKLGLRKSQAIAGGRYHNFKDFMKFPNLNKKNLLYPNYPKIKVPELAKNQSIIKSILKKDILIAYPYQSFNYIPQLIREASLNDSVTEINMTLYRLAELSSVATALISAVKNGKKVKVLTELRARFMEQENIEWSNRLKEEGVEIINTIPNIKVHSKILQIKIKTGLKSFINICHIGTGNFNESTANFYGDFSLFTADKSINLEISKVFKMIQNFKINKFEFKTLWVSPINTRLNLLKAIDNEIEISKKKKFARIIIKCNSLEDEIICNKLLFAAKSGVKVDLIVRGIFRLNLEKNEPNIKAISLVDNYLEHGRVFYFHNNGSENMFIGSADLMIRNLDHRVEVTTPILNIKHKELLIKYLNLQLTGSTKVRLLHNKLDNEYQPIITKERVRAQLDFYKILENHLV